MNWRQESQNSKIEENETELSIRIRDIQSRIATLRSRIEIEYGLNKVIEVETKHEEVRPVYTAEDNRLNRERELNDLKSKLLGKKK
jgi:hypothetical protein